MPESRFRIEEKGITELFFSPQGDVNKHMQDIGNRIVFVAKRLVGEDQGTTKRSIRSAMLRAPGAVIVEVSATSKAALLHHEGTRPHVIVPRRARALRFKQGGRVVYAQRVFHPGTRPNPYLANAMRAAVK